MMNAAGGGASRGADLVEQYAVRCPDVLELRVAGRPDLSGRRAVGPDGCLDLGDGGRPRVEGQTVAQVGHAVAGAAGLASADVHVEVAEYQSQHVYLFGEVLGQHRAVPYQGPETVVDLLRRVGGITAGAAPGDVHVIRAHVAEGKAPEVFRIDLPAILLKNDQGTNVRLRPFDQVYVGEARQAVVERCVPPCLRAAYHRLAAAFSREPGLPGPR